jgi:hypothetical protein
MVPATNDLLHMSDGVAAAVERESADATARAAGLNRLQRTFTRELQAAVRLEGLHEPSGNQEPTVRELLASILAAVLETNRLLQQVGPPPLYPAHADPQTGAALPAAASASPDLGVLPDDETVQPRASASPDLRSLPDEPPQPRSRTSPDPGVSSDEEPIRLYRRSPRVTRPLSAAAAEAAAYASDNDEEFMPPQRRASTGSPPFEGFDDADFE